MKSIEELLNRQAAELEELKAQHVLALSCPAPMAPSFVHLPSKWLAAGLSFRGTMEDVQGMMDALPPLQLDKAVDTFTCIRATEGGPYRYHVSVQEGPGFGPDLSLQWETLNLAGDPIRIRLDIQGTPHNWPAAASAIRREGGKVVRESRRPNRRLADAADSLIMWATGDAEVANFDYLFKDSPYEVLTALRGDA